MFLENKLELIYSDSILREYREILNRYSSKIDALKAEKALKAIEFLGVLCSPYKREFVTPDIDDHIFLRCGNVRICPSHNMESKTLP